MLLPLGFGFKLLGGLLGMVGRAGSRSEPGQSSLVLCLWLESDGWMAYPGGIEPGRTVNAQRPGLSVWAGRRVLLVILSQLPVYEINLFILPCSLRLRVQ